MAKDEDKGRVALVQLVTDMQSNMIAHIELQRIDAKLKRAKFLALVDEGFTEEQALLLCK